MPALLIRHRVADFAVWKQVFDEQQSTRWANGCQGSQVFRNTADPREVVTLLAWDDLMRAKLYSQSDDLREALQQSGVIDDPDLWILEQTTVLPG